MILSRVTALTRLALALNWILLVVAPAAVVASDLNPKPMGQYSTPNEPTGLALEGNRLLVACNPLTDGGTQRAGVLQVLDVSIPDRPAPRGTYFWPEQTLAGDLAISDHKAFVLVGTLGGPRLDIIDITDADAPIRVGSYRTGGEGIQVAPSGRLAAIANGEPGLLIVDVGDPANPRRVGGLDGMGDAWGISVSGNFAYVADLYWSGTQAQVSGALRIVDISDPASPRLTGKHQTRGPARSVFLVGHFAYVGTDMGMEVFDVSDPTEPKSLGIHGRGSRGIVLGDRAILGGSGGLQILDVANPAAPTRLGASSVSGNLGVVAAGQYAYAAGYTGLTILDLSVPAYLPRAEGVDTPGFARAIAVTEGRAYLADEGVGMQVIDLANPSRPVLIGSYALTNITDTVAAIGNRAVAVEARRTIGNRYTWTLHVLEVTDPVSPKKLGTYSTSGYSSPTSRLVHQALAVDEAGSMAFLGVGDENRVSGRIDVIDLRNASNPGRVASLGMTSEWISLAVGGQRLLAADIVEGLVVFDISDPAHPQVVGRHSTPGWAQVSMSGNRAFLTSRSRGFEVIDLTAPAQPMLLGSTLELGGDWIGSAASDRYVYGAASGSGVQVVDVGDPTRPTPISGNSAPMANGLVVSSNRLWLAADFEGLQSIDLAALATPDLPALTIDRSGQVVRLSWPANATGFVLESSASVAPSAIWAAHDLPTETVGDRRNVVLAPSQRERFFRLKKP